MHALKLGKLILDIVCRAVNQKLKPLGSVYADKLVGVLAVGNGNNAYMKAGFTKQRNCALGAFFAGGVGVKYKNNFTGIPGNKTRVLLGKGGSNAATALSKPA